MTARHRRRAAAREDAADHGTPERARHGEVVPRSTDVPGVAGRRVKHECRLDWYLDKASINDRQHEAGIRFRRDWLLAAAPPKVVGRYGLKLPPRHDFADAQIAARQRVARAVAALGTEATQLLVDVCCFDSWASERLPRLREALTRLADHLGLPREEGL